MAVTVIKTKKGLLRYRGVYLAKGPLDYFIELTLINDKFEPLSDVIRLEAEMSEKEFHKSLRKVSAENDQLITSHSTDPEWNPEGYVKNLK